MKLKVLVSNSYKYYIGYGQLRSDLDVSIALGLKVRRYRSILRKHGACKSYFGDYYFDTDEAARRVLPILEPYLVMAELIK